MTVNEVKETIELRKNRREEDIERLITINIKSIIRKLENGKIKNYEAIYKIKNIMNEIEEASQDVNEYWRVLDTLEWLV